MFKKVLVDCHAEIDLPRNRYWRNIEDIAKDLEVEAKELTAFIRDHRSRDSYHINIVREYKSLCEFCHREEERDNGVPVCCDKAIKEYEESNKVTVL
jgi:hypothetical protein